MNCTACGTRIAKNDRKCPNCGRTPKTSQRAGNAAGSPGAPLESSSAQIPNRRQGLRDPQTSGRSKARPSQTAVPPASPSDSHSQIIEQDSVSVPGMTEIREWIHDCPDRLEEGLSIYTDSNADPVGVNFSTEVGEIDLLALDDAGGLVVVLVPAPPADGSPTLGKDLVSAALERVGWVRKHVAETAQEVRAIVLLDQIPEDFSYAAAAVASTLSFKTYRMEVSFADVEV